MMYAALAILLGIVAFLVLSDGSSTVAGLEKDQLARLAFSGTLLTVFIAGFWHRFREQMGTNLKALLIWAALAVALVAGYAYKDEAGEVGNRLVGTLRPGSAVTAGDGTVTVTRRADGDFSVRAEVNGRTQVFQFDTGASSVVLTAENAAAIGISPAENEFAIRVSTANGIAMAAPIYLDSMTIGTITERRVSALVSRRGALSGNLLGMTFLDRLASYEVRGDRLVLRPAR
ncbi:TIGR02281 family clan AA aspartic protease [Methylobacterium sp. 77]|uniref:retropepsin-like aspartic protease family protein n=1 Tax=Methylobacterium sp. 77 TaxID=1101192 RepID=UPI00047DA4A2|nr:TIGR02281 family clan AA aspartic protease [Methylobacterium sp. 77]